MSYSMKTNRTIANESISKYKLLSAYGGPGSIVHTQYGSIIVSCIEEWGFLNRIISIHKEFILKETPEKELKQSVINDARLDRNGNIGISNDDRLLNSLQSRKGLLNLKYLVLIPDIEVVAHNNKIKEGVEVAVPSTYMPKVFASHKNDYKPYQEWYRMWVTRKSGNGDRVDKNGWQFHPPKYDYYQGGGKEWIRNLKQDNIVLLCEHGHISDFPWSKFLKWRIESPLALFDKTPIALFNLDDCCAQPQIRITSNTGNASGFDGKYLRCIRNGCIGNRGVSLKGLMGVKLKCPGHRPWEASTSSDARYPYSGDRFSRQNVIAPSPETCNCSNPMKVALSTGNNIYYSRTISSIYLHKELFESPLSLEIMELGKQKELAMANEDFEAAIVLREKISKLEAQQTGKDTEVESDTESELRFRKSEFDAFHKTEELLNRYPNDLKAKEVTSNLDERTSPYFKKVLRLDNMKITTAQLDFSRVVPIDADAEEAHPRNIFRSSPDHILAYPVVESFGEGIFFSFEDALIHQFPERNQLLETLERRLRVLQSGANSFNQGTIDFANAMGWPLYLVHTFSHLLMRELEFRCGYPTASLSERIYVSNESETRMYGCLIYTAEGGEGSMGGLIAQTRPANLNNLIKSAIKRATICNSDPLCWESDGQGLFDLNYSSCFSCSLVSETSCEHRNIYLDRRVLVDEHFGFFRDLITT